MSNIHKYLISFIVLLCSYSIASAQDSLVIKPKSADTTSLEKTGDKTLNEVNLHGDPVDLYNKKDYDSAAAIYEHLIQTKGGYSSYYYNLGNCFYRLGKMGPAILNYERALLLDPMDNDIKDNLRMAQLKTIDKITPGDTFFGNLWNTLSFSITLFTLNILGVVFFAVFLGGVVYYFLARTSGKKKLGFYIAVISLILCILFNMMGTHQRSQYTDAYNEAIIMEGRVSVRSTPDTNGTVVFNIHEGTKVKITGEEINNWYPIKIEDGKQGWLEKSYMEIINNNEPQ